MTDGTPQKTGKVVVIAMSMNRIVGPLAELIKTDREAVVVVVHADKISELHRDVDYLIVVLDSHLDVHLTHSPAAHRVYTLVDELRGMVRRMIMLDCRFEAAQRQVRVEGKSVHMGFGGPKCYDALRPHLMEKVET